MSSFGFILPLMKRRGIFIPPGMIRAVCIFGLLFLSACASVNTAERRANGQRRKSESPEEVKTAVQSVLGAVSGQEIDDKKLIELNQKIRTDKDAASAVQVIQESLEGKTLIKYCPVTGKRYSPRYERCPVHDVPLLILEE